MSRYLKSIIYTYRFNLKKNPKYDGVVPKREWKALQEDTKENRLRKEGRRNQMEEGIT